MSQPTVLVLPGWQNSGPLHWQSLWEAQHGYRRVEQHDWMRPLRGDWIARLEEVVLEQVPSTDGGAAPGIVLVAHSLGCHLAAAWAAHSQHRDLVQAALLVAPPDLDRSDVPPQLFNWRPVQRQHLPFAALLVHSEDDPFSSTEASLRLAADWAVPDWPLGQRGHVNAESGLGDWPEGLLRLQQLTAHLP